MNKTTRFFLGLIALSLICTPALAQNAVTQMWLGEELWKYGGAQYAGSKDPKEWQSMPGAILSFTYDGKGPLPTPMEFVIPLEKPLPLGNYRLFVKNFYMGKMQATLGDITRDLKIVRFDWTPGTVFEINEPADKIVLRYFPTMVQDNAAAQSQGYIVQGVFVTTETNKVPIKGGEIITLNEQAAPQPRAGNYLQNGSFEAGLFPWGKSFGFAKFLQPSHLDDTTATEGKYSLKFTGESSFLFETPMFRLPTGPYTVSFFAKSDKPTSVALGVMGLKEDLKGDAQAGLAGNVQLSSEWKRYSVSGTINAMPANLYYLQVTTRSAEPATVWIDAVQLQNGSMTDYQPAAEVGYLPNTPGNIYYEKEPCNVEVLVAGASGASADVGYRIFDLYEKEVAKGQLPVTLQKGAGRAKLELFNQRRGIFRVLLTHGDRTAEMVYSVVPANTHLTSYYAEGSLGTDASGDPALLAILKRANFNWVLSKFIGRWYQVEPEQGQYKFPDVHVKAAKDAKMMVVIQLLNIDWGMQKWLKPYWIPEGGGEWEPQKKQFYFDHWAKFVDAMVVHFKDSVKHWEIENEPNAGFGSGALYGEFLKLSSQTIRKADPEAKVVGFSGGGFSTKFFEPAMQAAGVESVDVISAHFYGNDAPYHASFGKYIQKYNRPGWNTETGPTCPTFFTTLPGFESLRQKNYDQEMARENRGVAAVSAINYLTTLSYGRMEKWFHYFARMSNCSPSQPTRWFGGGKEINEFDGSLRANGVALCIASHFVDGAKFDRTVSGELLDYQLMRQGKGTVGFCWSKGQQLSLTLPAAATLKWFDMMGNPVEGPQLAVQVRPVYFTSEQPPEAIVPVLQGIKIVPAATQE